MANAKIRLLYFDGKGRAELARLLLAAGGKKYEDVRFSMEDWPKFKPSTPYGQAPALEVDGVMFAESIAISSFLAREFNFYGKNNLENFKIDELVQLYNDYFTKAIDLMFHTNDTAKKNEGIKKFKEEDAPRYLGFLEANLKKNGTGYFVGDSITLADILALDLNTGTMNSLLEITDNYPLLKKNLELVKGQDKIAAYLASRKQTEW
ncbi:S-crystallin SL11-like [Physella acuta]|uniref:S-crystallin SL11-like n=1 Tax=Physella acuta TaxID=109671 RepID=UPI0027DC8476|nr:S-crystallin SL11-like [Physella acuta]XP_059155474.1 S-crystallin SL11-like [Physella acuta]